jgi:hypothetical protein
LKHFQRICVLSISILLLVACYIAPNHVPAETPAIVSPAATLPRSSAYPWTDENAVMSGICFEAALDAVGKDFVFRSAQEHSRLYDLADNSHLCREPVTRIPFEFANGRVLAGLWRAAEGCSASYDGVDVKRDDTAKTIAIELRLVVEGTCGYELVEPFWIGLDNAADYQVRITVK